MGKLTLFEVAILLIFLQMAIQSGMSYPNIQENEPNKIQKYFGTLVNEIINSKYPITKR